MTARSTPCDRCRLVYTTRRFCDKCSGSGADELPPPEDRFADVRAQARTVTTPETRRQAPPPVMPAPGRHVRATLPTLDAVVTVGTPIAMPAKVDRQWASLRIGFLLAHDLSEDAVAELLATAERLKGRAA